MVKPKFSISTTYQFYFTNSTGNTATMVNKETERMTCSILYPMFDRTAPVSGLACGYGFFNHNSPYSVWDTLRIRNIQPKLQCASGDRDRNLRPQVNTKDPLLSERVSRYLNSDEIRP